MKVRAKNTKTAKAAKANGAFDPENPVSSRAISGGGFSGSKKLNGKVQALKVPRTKAEAEAQMRDLIKENKKALHALAKL